MQFNKASLRLINRIVNARHVNQPVGEIMWDVAVAREYRDRNNTRVPRRAYLLIIVLSRDVDAKTAHSSKY